MTSSHCRESLWEINQRIFLWKTRTWPTWPPPSYPKSEYHIPHFDLFCKKKNNYASMKVIFWQILRTNTPSHAIEITGFAALLSSVDPSGGVAAVEGLGSQWRASDFLCRSSLHFHRAKVRFEGKVQLRLQVRESRWQGKNRCRCCCCWVLM